MNSETTERSFRDRGAVDEIADGYGGFSVGRSELPAVRRYIAAQKEHHLRVSYDEEFVSLLDEHGVAYDARYLWG